MQTFARNPKSIQFQFSRILTFQPHKTWSDYITDSGYVDFCDDLYQISSVIAPRGFQNQIAQTSDGRSFVSLGALCTVRGMYLVG